MKKINYLFAIIATVLVLGTTSCDTSNDPAPMTEDDLKLSQFDGVWNTVTTTYESVDYDQDVVCNELNVVNSWKNTTFEFNSTTSKVSVEEFLPAKDICQTLSTVTNATVSIVGSDLFEIKESISSAPLQFKVLSIDPATNYARIQLVKTVTSMQLKDAIYTVWLN